MSVTICMMCKGTGFTVKTRTHSVPCEICCPHNKGRMDMPVYIYGKAHKDKFYCALCGVVFINQTSMEFCQCSVCVINFADWAELAKVKPEDKA